MKEILYSRIRMIYSGESSRLVLMIGKILEPELKDMVNMFYGELLGIPETAVILKNAVVEKNLRRSLGVWLQSLFQDHSSDIQALIERQREIGTTHANINVNLNFFNHGIGILKREIYTRLGKNLSGDELMRAFLVVGELFDILVLIISESYFSNEMSHENNELSLKIKGITHNTAIECERLRSMLFDWLCNTLTFLYQSPDIHMDSLPKLQYSNFGLWVVYKADFLSHSMNVSADLKKHIREIDEALFQAARHCKEGDSRSFFDAVKMLNDAVTKCSWFMSSIVDQALELDTGMDPLTRLFNRRYMSTILRRQTDISMRQGFPYSILMVDLDHFKRINDEYGHDCGDAVLKQFSEILLLSVRTSDFIFRFGGEEFLIVLGNVDKTGARDISEKIQTKCGQHLFQLPGNRIIKMTCSIGAAVYDGHPDYNRLIKQADTALYQAKEQGRNRVVLV
jgi:diguanylate cyclase